MLKRYTLQYVGFGRQVNDDTYFWGSPYIQGLPATKVSSFANILAKKKLIN